MAAMALCFGPVCCLGCFVGVLHLLPTGLQHIVQGRDCHAQGLFVHASHWYTEWYITEGATMGRSNGTSFGWEKPGQVRLH